MKWTDQIKTEPVSMVAKKEYIDIEELYQSFKERLIKELRVSTDELMNYAELVDVEDV